MPFDASVVMAQVNESPSVSVALKSYCIVLPSDNEKDNALFPEEMIGGSLDKIKSFRIPEWAVQK